MANAREWLAGTRPRTLPAYEEPGAVQAPAEEPEAARAAAEEPEAAPAEEAGEAE